MNLQEYTRIIREILVSKPLQEAAIVPGMKILFAEAVPIGLITVEIGNVIETIDGRLNYGTRVFTCFLPTGKEGKYKCNLNHKLEAASPPQEDTIGRKLCDKMKAIGGSDDKYFTEYNNGLFTFSWRTTYLENIEVAEKAQTVSSGKSIILCTKKDPRRIRFGVPGDIINPDENTLEYSLNEGASWLVKQRVVDGPTGRFSALGYRQIPDEVYGRMFNCEKVVPLFQYRK